MSSLVCDGEERENDGAKITFDMRLKKRVRRMCEMQPDKGWCCINHGIAKRAERIARFREANLGA